MVGAAFVFFPQQTRHGFCCGVAQADGLVGWLVGWLAGWLAGWLVGWVVGWLGGWVVEWFGWLAEWQGWVNIPLKLCQGWLLVRLGRDGA